MTETRVRQPSTYDLVYEDPPASRGNSQLFDVLSKLIADGSVEWARVVDCQSRSGANSILTSVRQGKRLLPEPMEHFEFRTTTSTEPVGSSLYVRYVGAEGAAAAAAAPAKARRGRPPGSKNQAK